MAGIQAMLAKFAAEQQARTAAAMETARLQAASLQTSGAEHCQQLHRRAEEARTSLQVSLAPALIETGAVLCTAVCATCQVHKTSNVSSAI